MRKKNIRNKTYCHVVSDFKDKFSLGGFPFHAIPGLARRQSVYALVLLAQRTFLGELMYNFSAASWYSCHELMYTMIVRRL